MKSSSSSFSANLGTNGLTANILRKGVLRQLASLRNGQLVVIEGDERHVFGKAARRSTPKCIFSTRPPGA
ncbi:hypothetical protein CU663_13010 [Pseudomonas syringae pv. actinidifoliorum]|nr:hypothetical protein [Pseudomonas syringae pv. actinidifoliorum]